MREWTEHISYRITNLQLRIIEKKKVFNFINIDFRVLEQSLKELQLCHVITQNITLALARYSLKKTTIFL